MEKDERNRIMDGLLAVLNDGDDGYFTSHSNQANAIRECDKLARAWDGLVERLDSAEGKGLPYRGTIIRWMAELLSPTTKDPLEELEEWVSGKWRNSKPAPHPVWVNVDSLLAKIRRLRGKK